ncbi:MAG TPA: hypothetical protein VFU47_09570 [Armatimonadota bacterium]|nr:hypothetical protein [Armatimonadota bacterium]
MNCLFCNEAIHPKDVSCPTCGYPVQEDTTLYPDATPALRRPLESRWVRVAIGAAGLCIASLVAGVVLGRLSAPPAQASAASYVPQPLSTTVSQPSAAPVSPVTPIAPIAAASAPEPSLLPDSPLNVTFADDPAVSAPIHQPLSPIARVLAQPAPVLPVLPVDRDGDSWGFVEPRPKQPMASRPEPLPPSHLLVLNPLAQHGGFSVSAWNTVPGLNITSEFDQAR